MKALVTGGAGFIGSHVVRRLRDENVEVRVLDNLSTGTKVNIDKAGVEFIEGDVRNPSLLDRIMAGMDAVFHLAASIGNVKSLGQPREDSDVNVLGTINVLEAARRHSVKRIVYSSSAAIFGEPVVLPIGEDHPQNPDSPYGVSKLAGEKHALCYRKVYGLDVVCLRYFNVYGVNQRYDAYGNVIPIFAERLIGGKPLIIFGDGEQTRDFINARDVATANFLAAVKAPRGAVYNIGCGRSLTINQLARTMQRAAGIETSIEYAPPRKGEVRHCRADVKKLGEDLGFVPDGDIEDGLREYLSWFKEEKDKRPA